MSGAIFLNERTRFGGETAAGALRNACAFTSRDMSGDWPEAFTYAIVTGWDDDDNTADGAMDYIAERFGWDDELIAFLRNSHDRFKQLADKHEVTA